MNKEPMANTDYERPFLTRDVDDYTDEELVALFPVPKDKLRAIGQLAQAAAAPDEHASDLA